MTTNNKPLTLTIVATLPPELAEAWLQHVRDFDAAHAGCHFHIVADVDLPTAQILDILQHLDPPLPNIALFERKKPS
jgi:hypothetical protein